MGEVGHRKPSIVVRRDGFVERAMQSLCSKLGQLDALEMVRKRHPDVCEVTVRLLRDRYFGLRFERVASRDTLLDPKICRGPVGRRMRGRIATNWRCSRIMTQHSHGTGGTTPPTEGTVLPRLQTDSRALMRSPGGPRASALHLLPCARNTAFDAQIFRVFVLRGLWLPLPSSSHVCQCGHRNVEILCSSNVLSWQSTRPCCLHCVTMERFAHVVQMWTVLCWRLRVEEKCASGARG